MKDKIFSWSYSLFWCTLFLSLGVDRPGHVLLRMGFLGLLLIFSVLANRGQPVSFHEERWVFVFLGALLCFEICRALLAVICPGSILSSGDLVLRKVYASSPVRWGFYGGAFCLAFFWYRSRQRIYEFLPILGAIIFFVGGSIIPSALLGSLPGFSATDGTFTVFLSVFYAKPWIAEYLLSRYGNANMVGDYLVFGFFPLLGFAIYASLQAVRDKKSRDLLPGRTLPVSKLLSLAALALSGAMVAGVTTFLVFSRGTILSFLAAFCLYLCVLIFKLRKSRIALGALIIIGVAAGLVFWAGNFKAAWKEIRTLQTDDVVFVTSSMDYNRVGHRRARQISLDYPIWGVGTQGFQKISSRYADPGEEEKFILINSYAMNHYEQALAEEGIGAYFYFGFLTCAFLVILIKLWKTDSRFKIFMGASFAAPCLAVFGHAAGGYLLEQLSISLLTYMSLGMSLAILSNDFTHGASKEIKARAILE